GVTATRTTHFALAWLVGAATSVAQTPDLQELQNKLQQVEESTQKTIKELKAQIDALEQGQKSPKSASSPAGVQSSLAPTVEVPAEHYGTETKTRETAGQYEAGAPRVDNEPLDPELRGFIRLPNTHTFMKFGGFVKTDVLYDLNYAGTYYGAY